MESPLPSIPIEEVEFHHLSYEDGAGRLFWRHGRLYRGLTSSLAPFYGELFQRGVIDEIVQQGLLVESRRTSDSMEGYPGIVEHSVVPFVSFAYEWCPEMLRSAGRLVLDLAAHLHRRGLELADGHAWNVLFQGPHPLFVDLGAIRPPFDDSRWLAAEQFREHFINPLYLVSAGAEDIARSLIQTNCNGAVLARQVKHFNLSEKLVQRTRARAASLARYALPSQMQELLRRKFPRHRSRGSKAAHLDSLREELESIELPQPETRWSSYYDKCLPLWEHNPERDAKLRCVLEILDRIAPASVLDVGANRGRYALATAKPGVSVVAIDADGTCVGRLYSDALNKSLPVLPLIMDIRNASPRGLCGEIYPAPWERLGCDLVLAFAIVHHLALAQRLTFDQIVRCLKRFSKRCLLVEFPTGEDYMVMELRRKRDCDEYTSDNFQNTLKRYFGNIERFPSNSHTREIYFCEC
jgi:SAM-dependent methyltransferase